VPVAGSRAGIDHSGRQVAVAPSQAQRSNTVVKTVPGGALTGAAYVKAPMAAFNAGTARAPAVSPTTPSSGSKQPAPVAGTRSLINPNALPLTQSIGHRDAIVALPFGRRGVHASRVLLAGPASFLGATAPAGGHAVIGRGSGALPSIPYPALPFSGWEGSASLLTSSSSAPGVAGGLLLAGAAFMLMIRRRLLRQTVLVPPSILLSNLVPPG
jgi:hypothetical protein